MLPTRLTSRSTTFKKRYGEMTFLEYSIEAILIRAVIYAVDLQLIIINFCSNNE